MAEILIPKEVVQGFDSIIKLSKKSVEQISQYLYNIEISTDPNAIFYSLDTFIRTELKIKNSTEIVQTIASFINLLDENTYTKVAENISNSFKELHSPEITTKDFLSLRNNLEQLLKSCEKLVLSIKSNRLLIRENSKTYQKSKVVSDIRLVFNKDISDKSRRAILVHNLHITYKSNNKNKNFFIALDLKDLNSIKEEIDRAIKKDKIIKSDYQDFELI